ncbi:hypothetical protein PISMIDRAFT_281579 [Pisolithus microcarpus 441]|uniref:Uncharacterized protein n=1 Tax=Pisolithus microcarpus 441 TaxID=765257 RepID=A0A0C9Z7Q9_9AGAM|nr:hypothetical protein PISMIDRAFT_281579 [Pisolithus microcarpus 441]
MLFSYHRINLAEDTTVPNGSADGGPPFVWNCRPCQCVHRGNLWHRDSLARFAMCIPVSASQLKPALIGHDGCGNRNTGKTDKANANSRRSLNGKECAGENALPRTRDA